MYVQTLCHSKVIGDKTVNSQQSSDSVHSELILMVSYDHGLVVLQSYKLIIIVIAHLQRNVFFLILPDVPSLFFSWPGGTGARTTSLSWSLRLGLDSLNRENLKRLAPRPAISKIAHLRNVMNFCINFQFRLWPYRRKV